jgi:hypothetical protein
VFQVFGSNPYQQTRSAGDPSEQSQPPSSVTLPSLNPSRCSHAILNSSTARHTRTVSRNSMPRSSTLSPHLSLRRSGCKVYSRSGYQEEIFEHNKGPQLALLRRFNYRTDDRAVVSDSDEILRKGNILALQSTDSTDKYMTGRVTW